MMHKLNPNYTFENFIVAYGNDKAYKICTEVAQSPGAFHNPLIIIGCTAFGKTHLLHAIGNYCASNNHGLKIHVTNAGLFFEGLTRAIKKGRLKNFRSSFKKVNLLLIDSIHLFVNKVNSQEELLQIFNLFRQGETASPAQIVCSLDQALSKASFNEMLKAYLSSGTTVRIKKPDLKTRIEIVTNCASEDGFEFAPDAAARLASKIMCPRKLQGFCTYIKAYASLALNHRHITLDCNEKLLKIYKI